MAMIGMRSIRFGSILLTTLLAAPLYAQTDPAPVSPAPAPAPAPTPAPATPPATKPTQQNQTRNQPERPAPRRQNPPTAPRPAAAPAPAAPAPAPERNTPVGVLDELPDLDFGFLPGYDELARESVDVGARAAEESAPEAESNETEDAAPQGPGFFDRLWEKLGADRTYLNLLFVVGIVILFVLYRLRGGRARR